MTGDLFLVVRCLDDKTDNIPDSKVHGANMGPTWVLLAPGGPHVGLMNLDIWDSNALSFYIMVSLLQNSDSKHPITHPWGEDTVYPKKYAHGFVVLCFVVVMQSFIMNSHEVFIHIHQGCLAGTGAIVRLPQCQWSKPDGYGKISQCITTTKHSKAKTVCIFLGIYCKRCLKLVQSMFCALPEVGTVLYIKYQGESAIYGTGAF